MSCSSNGAAGRGEAAVPGAAQMRQDERGGADGRDLLRGRQILRAPGQDRRRAVGRMVAEPRFRRPHDASGRFARPAPREAADDPSLRLREPAEQCPRRARPPADRGTRAASAPRPARSGFPIAGRRAPRAAPRRSAARRPAPSSSCRDRCRWKTAPPSQPSQRAATACGPGTRSSISGPSWRASSRARACRAR